MKVPRWLILLVLAELAFAATFFFMTKTGWVYELAYRLRGY